MTNLDSILKVKVKVTQSCTTLCDPLNYTVHRILQAKILEWVAFPFPGYLPNPRIKPTPLTLQTDSLPVDPQGKPSISKSRDITLLTKVCLFKAMVFPVVLYGCESWTIIKAEHQRIDAFKLWCLRRLLRVPWAARRSSQSILKEINPEYSF